MVNLCSFPTPIANRSIPLLHHISNRFRFTTSWWHGKFIVQLGNTVQQTKKTHTDRRQQARFNCFNNIVKKTLNPHQEHTYAAVCACTTHSVITTIIPLAQPTTAVPESSSDALANVGHLRFSLWLLPFSAPRANRREVIFRTGSPGCRLFG